MEKQVSGLVSNPASSAARILGTDLRPGNNLTLALGKEGIVTVTLDHVGDWTITIGLAAGTARIATIADGLTKLGFFHAADSDGVSYLLWTSAFEETDDRKSLTEQVLFQALRTIQNDTSRAQYIS